MWRWCLHCQRGYHERDARHVGGMRLCAYADCDGSVWADGWAWERMRELWGYPDVPEWGKVYPQYGS